MRFAIGMSYDPTYFSGPDMETAVRENLCKLGKAMGLGTAESIWVKSFELEPVHPDAVVNSRRLTIRASGSNHPGLLIPMGADREAQAMVRFVD